MPITSGTCRPVSSNHLRHLPEVIAAEPARAHADHVIAELDREIESLLFDTRVRQELVSRTALTLLERAAARRHRALQLPAVPVVDPTPLNQGGVSSVNPGGVATVDLSRRSDAQ